MSNAAAIAEVEGFKSEFNSYADKNLSSKKLKYKAGEALMDRFINRYCFNSLNNQTDYETILKGYGVTQWFYF